MLLILSYKTHGCKEMDAQDKKVFNVSWWTSTMIWAANIKLHIDQRNMKLYTAYKSSLLFVTWPVVTSWRHQLRQIIIGSPVSAQSGRVPRCCWCQTWRTWGSPGTHARRLHPSLPWVERGGTEAGCPGRQNRGVRDTVCHGKGHSGKLWLPWCILSNCAIDVSQCSNGKIRLRRAALPGFSFFD